MCSDLGVGLQSVVYDIAKVASQVMGSCYLMKVKEACWMIRKCVYAGSGHCEQLRLQPEKTGFVLSTLKV